VVAVEGYDVVGRVISEIKSRYIDAWQKPCWSE
jgi:hypothetical protein